MESDVAATHFRLDVGLIKPSCLFGAIDKVGGVDHGVLPMGEGQVSGITLDKRLESGDAIQFEADFPEGFVKELKL